MINMKDLRVYLLLVLVMILVVGFIAAGKTSPAYKPAVAQTINCSAVNLNFSYPPVGSIKAPEGTNTFFPIYINNTGNVTERVGLRVKPVGSVPFLIESSNATEINASAKGYVSFGIYSPSKTGNYSVTANISAGYLNCAKYALMPVAVTVTNST